MKHLHNLLKRQLKRHFGDSFSVPAEWQKFISSVDEAYGQFDADRGMIERSLDLSSQELLLANEELRAYQDHLEELVKDRTAELQREITERKAIEEVLRESQERFRALTENSQDVIMRFDRHYRHVYVNSVVEQQTGIPVKEFIGKTHKELGFPGHLCELWESAIQKVFETGKLQRIEFQLPNNIWIDWLIMPEFTANSFVKYVITSARDITERKRIEEELRRYHNHLEELVRERTSELQREITERRRAEEALKTSEEKFRTLVENINIGVYRATGDNHGSFMQANPAIMKMFGFDSMEEFMKISVSDLYIDREQRIHFLDELKKSGYVKDKELRMLRKDGMPIWTSCTANIQYDEHGDIQWIDGVIEDITERKKIEEQLRQAQKMDAIGTLAGGVAHDFNNILTAIIGYGNLLKEDVKKDTHLENYACQILAAAEKAAFLTQSLLAFGRKQIFNLRPANINEIVGKMETLLLRVIGEDIELKTFLTSGDIVVMADASQLEQVLMNLAVNARDAMPDGGSLTIETETVLLDNEFISAHGFGTVGPHALITVEDSGHGMDKKIQARIFEPFFTTKEVGKGTGLGLSMVYGIIKQHDGYINVYSETGKGSIFRIYLPLVESETEEIESAAAYTPPEGGTETILVAEDNTEVRRFIRHILERSGYIVIEAVDGEDALEKFLIKGDSIQLLVLDVIMPQKSGKEVYEEIRKIKPDIKVIFTSGYTADIIHRKGVLEKGLNFISKPVSPDKLLRKIRETLGK